MLQGYCVESPRVYDFDVRIKTVCSDDENRCVFERGNELIDSSERIVVCICVVWYVVVILVQLFLCRLEYLTYIILT